MRLSGLVLSLLLLGAAADAAEWRLRAREHFETGQADLADGRGELSYRGILSAVDLFYEEPFHYMAGLTVHRGRYAQPHGPGRVAATSLGLEGKLFPAETVRWWFLRTGLLATALDPAGPGKDMWVYGGSLGTGAEFPVWKLGLAPEVGGRWAWGSRGRTLRTFYAALGVHFYVFPGDRLPDK